MDNDSSDEEGAHAVSTLASLLSKVWPDKQPLSSLGQLLHALSSMALPDGLERLQPHFLVGEALQVLQSMRTKSDTHKAPTARSGKRAHSTTSRTDFGAGWMSDELANEFAGESAAVRNWATGIMHAAIGYLLKEHSTTPAELTILARTMEGWRRVVAMWMMQGSLALGGV